MNPVGTPVLVRSALMPNPNPSPQKPVLGRPPVDGSEAELEAWTEAFLDMLLGPEEGSGTLPDQTG
jgi:hypothetical protein